MRLLAPEAISAPDKFVNSPVELASVRHLAELGYEDPLDAAARRAIAERSRQAELARAQEHLNAGRTSEALTALERLIEAAPEWAPPRRALAIAHYHTGRLAAARQQLDWLELHAIEHAQLSLMRAAIDLSQRRLDAAIDQAQYARHLMATAAAPASVAPDLIIGEAHVRRGELDAAEEAYARAHQQSPADAGALAGLAGVALRQGDDEAAVDWALQALEQNMETPLAHYLLGAGLVRLGQLAEARLALESFARLAPHRAAPYRWLAAICEQQEDGVAAAEFRERGRRIVRERQNSSGSLPVEGREPEFS